MPSEDDRSHEYWQREVAWNRATLRSYLRDYNQMNEKLEQQMNQVKRLQGNVELFKRVCQTLRDGVVTIIVISLIMMITLRLIENNSEKIVFVISWALFCAVVSLALLFCSAHLWKLQERLAKEKFQQDAFEYELGRIADDIEYVKRTLLRLEKTAPEACGEVQSLFAK